MSNFLLLILSFLQINCYDTILSDLALVQKTLLTQNTKLDILEAYDIIMPLENKYIDSICEKEADDIMRHTLSKIKDLIFYSFVLSEYPDRTDIILMVEQLTRDIEEALVSLQLIVQPADD